MASTYDSRGRLLHIDASAPYVNGPSGLTGGNGLTDPLHWANQFRRNDNQIQQQDLPGNARQAQPEAPHPSITQGILNDILPMNPFANPFTTNLALNTGQNQQPQGLQFGAPPSHVDFWKSNVGRFGAQATQRTPAGVTTGFSSPYGAGQTTFGGGPRQPYIGGAQGDMTSDFVAGGKYSSRKNRSDDPTLDQTFSFGSAFR